MQNITLEQQRLINPRENELDIIIPLTEITRFDSDIKRTFFSNLKENYELEPKIVEVKEESLTVVAPKVRKGITLRDLLACKSKIEVKYKESYKHNVKGSLANVKKIERAIRSILENRYEDLNSLDSLNINLLNLVSKQKVTRPFLELVEEFRELYPVYKSGPIDVSRFTNFLRLCNYQFEKEDFLQAALIVNKK